MFGIALRLIQLGHRRRPVRPRPVSPGSSLDNVPAGQSVQVIEIAAGRAANLQLAQLGIRSGARLAVRRSAPLGGPVLVESAGSVVAIGRGMARKVHVKSLE